MAAENAPSSVLYYFPWAKYVKDNMPFHPATCETLYDLVFAQAAVSGEELSNMGFDLCAENYISEYVGLIFGYYVSHRRHLDKHLHPERKEVKYVKDMLKFWEVETNKNDQQIEFPEELAELVCKQVGLSSGKEVRQLYVEFINTMRQTLKTATVDTQTW